MIYNRLIYIIFYIYMSFAFAEEIFNGYTLFTPQVGFNDGAITYLMDNEFNVVHAWLHENSPASMPYLIPGEQSGLNNTFLLYPYRVNNPSMENGGVGGAVQCLNWEGEILWEFILSNDDFQHHHDIEPLPNGNILLIAWNKKTAEEAYSMGREEIDNPLNQIWSESIFEIEPNGNGGAEIVWEWHLWDHLVQDVCLDCPNYATISDHPELFNINKGHAGSPVGPGGSNADWIHINAISYHEEWDQIVFSSRYQSEIFVIDHSTTTDEAAGHTGGNYGKGGDFLYRWGNPQNYNRGSEFDQLISDQHSINWISQDSPGMNNFILFNNYHSGGGPSGESAVLEFIPPVDNFGNYIIEDGMPYGPDNYIWSYEGDIFSAMQGGAFRLPNGNTLITDCDSAVILEVTEAGEIVWEYQHLGNGTTVIARAQKYDVNYFDVLDGIFGDVNNDEQINILDIIVLMNLILNGGEVFSEDLNEDGTLNILDIILLVNLILNEGF